MVKFSSACDQIEVLGRNYFLNNFFFLKKWGTENLLQIEFLKVEKSSEPLGEL